MNAQDKNTPASKLSRRRFIKVSGGITFLVATQGIIPGCQVNDAETLEEISSAISAWVRLGSSGTITVMNPAAEMGQGSMTALAVIIAEELDADWSKVKIEHSPIEPDTYGLQWGGELGGPMITVGSRTVAGYYDALRLAGAQARFILMKNAADKWEVPVEELSTEPGVVLHESSGRQLTYGEIAEFVKVPEELPEITPDQLKDPAQFRLIGGQITRRDIPEKVDGSALYSIDVRLPEMAYGVIARSPAHGTKPTLGNEVDILAMEGVLKIVMLDHGVGIIAESVEQALEAKRALSIEWSEEAHSLNHDSQSAYAYYASLIADKSARDVELIDEGNADRALRQAGNRYAADYKNDYVYHAQMEPLNAVAKVADDGQSAEIWVGSQAPDGARRAVAEALGLEFEQVKLHPHYLGGGFGRRSMSDYAVEAALLASETERPVKLIWTREDDVQYGAFRPISLQRMEAAVDNEGTITAFSHIVAGPGGRLLASGAETPYYTFDNQYLAMKEVDHGIRTKHWRAVAHGPNKFAIEAFIDEIAADLGRDPLEYRLHLMRNHPRAQKVLQTAAQMAGWGESVPQGRARGLAFAERSRSLGAMVCEISLDRATGEIRVHHCWAAIDAGVVVHPDNVAAQMEGGIIMGISSVLKERITFESGRVQQSNFDDYPILRISEAPESVRVQIIDSQEAPTGVGESG
ncbi:MAG: molybdopterin cofactor-binding domain-containing protein, partial [Saprospiraceae bacterium]|nr:molybdopterin cofactor-binding domain-containing protein [Saprospiraceae bacterium]